MLKYQLILSNRMGPISVMMFWTLWMGHKIGTQGLWRSRTSMHQMSSDLSTNQTVELLKKIQRWMKIIGPHLLVSNLKQYRYGSASQLVWKMTLIEDVLWHFQYHICHCKFLFVTYKGSAVQNIIACVDNTSMASPQQIKWSWVYLLSHYSFSTKKQQFGFYGKKRFFCPMRMISLHSENHCTASCGIF